MISMGADNASDTQSFVGFRDTDKLTEILAMNYFIFQDLLEKVQSSLSENQPFFFFQSILSSVRKTSIDHTIMGNCRT